MYRISIKERERREGNGRKEGREGGREGVTKCLRPKKETSKTRRWPT
jgi:hypothetical protein